MAQREDINSADEALNAIRGAKADVADRFTRGGVVYDIIYAVLVGEMTAGMGLGIPLGLVNEGVALAGLLLLARWWKHRTGVWLSGVWPAKARWVAIGVGLVFGVGMLVNFIWAKKGGGLWLPVVVGCTVAVVAFFGARLWTRVYRRESGLKS